MAGKMRTGYATDDGLVCAGYGNLKGERLTAGQAIKHFCVECQGGHYYPWQDSNGKRIPKTMTYTEVEECESTGCWLHPYRMGKRPK